MTTDTQAPAPHIPQSLHAAMGEWGRHETRKSEIDSDLSQLDVRIGEYASALAELREAHAALGRELTDTEREAEFARDMVEHGCARIGIEMPAAPVPQPPAQPTPAPLPSGVEPVSGQQAVQALADLSPSGPLETVTDQPPEPGGDQPEPGFQPDPSESAESAYGVADSRRRRGGRRADR